MKDLANKTALESRKMNTTIRIYQEDLNTASTDQQLNSSILSKIEAKTAVFNPENNEDFETNYLDYEINYI
ncbi:3455_t:CDS:2 [Dentiscutata erythropus]|uniref:3455_t:CDS:1 n=1 Tax=Dentiscutata erythropus TaxID=1348616 RepID=A0A9N9J4W3_9GLOM|nr:3455_t:CDS:2 [Dentiscutata erythropus]